LVQYDTVIGGTQVSSLDEDSQASADQTLERGEILIEEAQIEVVELRNMTGEGWQEAYG
jgi:hypothetical protein